MERIWRFSHDSIKNIEDRQVDTLIGLSKGLVADRTVNQSEAKFLLSWLIQNQPDSGNPIIDNLLQKVVVMLEDGILDPDKSEELKNILQAISGGNSEIGELAKTTSLPINAPLP
ncbi:hypothetical protein [Marinomonas ushuaiensis]|uniref:hypothetical protein n=1 Tax=Marinomonas ushuaiensis TaxID=263818 RepID=UPI0004B5EA85|nr:hypothetical protein [Marinomonas ushuaiensis]